ncbi:MAG: hypothetical protein LCH95_15050 [Proteobacteria bacterium]|nr:hypothetical protein [Pseudomonadota bacterium]
MIVVDQSTDNETRDRLLALGEPRRSHYATNTVGVSVSRNLAIRRIIARFRVTWPRRDPLVRQHAGADVGFVTPLPLAMCIIEACHPSTCLPAFTSRN